MSDQRHNPTDAQIPWSPDAEEAVLGAILTNPNAYFTVASFLEKDDFFLLRHQYIWEAIRRIVIRSEEFDYLTVGVELDDMGHLDEVGSVPYLMRLINNTPTSVHAEVYGQLVKRTSVRRQLLKTAEDVKAVALMEDLSLERVIQEVEARVFKVLAGGTESRTVSIKEGSGEYYDHISAIQRGETQHLGIPTGFKALDELTKGAQRGQLIYVAGRPGMGKTALMLSLALYAARLDQRVFVWSGEMTVKENIARLIALESQIDTQRLQVGDMSPQELDRFTEVALNRLSNLKMWIDDTSGITVHKLHSLLKRHQMLYGLDMVIVDYVGLMTEPGSQNRTNEQGAISRGLKRMGMDLNVPVYAGAQLSRACEQRQDKRPVLSDLRDSGDLEADANVVMFLYRDAVYNPQTQHPDMAEVIVAKNRNGPTGMVPLRFNRPITRFENGHFQHIDLHDD